MIFLKTIRLAAIMSMVLLFMACGIAAGAPVNSQGMPQKAYNHEDMRPNGELEVYLLESSQWTKVGNLPFDKYLREGEKDLGGFLPAGDPVKVRLVQKGGGSAHLDSVFLGDAPPLTVNGGEGFPLDKLSKKDFDVINVGSGGIELEFPAAGEGASLAVTARIEGLVISKVPFQFPLSNLYEEMDEHAVFYRYEMDSNRAGIAVDENIAEVSGRDPFFKEYVYPGSGHPPGLIYCWVMNDSENLYVTLDTTPDNTMDGDKDYAKVYVKTATGLKEFKVSVPETRWGRPGFTYTDKVDYQHKVYEFAIPLEEIGKSSSDVGSEILLAFSAYGTMSPGNYYPALGYDPGSNSYLAVYQNTASGSIRGQLVDSEGILSGSDFFVSDDQGIYPSVAQGVYGVDNVYLVVWEDSATIYGKMLFAATGTPVGGTITISDSPDANSGPVVAYDGENQVYLVAWEDWRDGNGDIYAQVVNADGSLEGVNFPVSSTADIQRGPSVACYSGIGSNKFLVAWEDLRSGNSDIYAQLVNADRSLDGGNFSVSSDVNDQSVPSVACDNDSGNFLVVWEDYRNELISDADIYAQLVTVDGSPDGGNYPVSNAPGYQNDPSVSYDGTSGRFLAAWEDTRNGPDNIFVQLLNASGGSLAGNDFAVFVNDEYQRDPTVANNSTDSQFMVAYHTQDEENNYVIAFSRVFALDSEAVATDEAGLTFNMIANNNSAPDNISSDLNLITTGQCGSTIAWASSDEDLIGIDGQVTQPSDLPDQTVTLTATISRGSASATVVFDLTVIAITSDGTTTGMVSLHSDGTQGNDSSLEASISADGRYVAFYSYASNLVSDDTNGSTMDVFVHDRQSGTTTRASVSSTGVQGNSGSRCPYISPDGRYVAFTSGASNLVPGDTNGEEDVFLRDRDADEDGIFDEVGAATTERISVSGAGVQAAPGSWNYYPTVSYGGRYVAFRSDAANLVENDTNGIADIFVRDRQTGSTTRVSVSSTGVESDSDCYNPVISSNGRYVAFTTGAATLVPSITDFGIYIHDLQTGQTVWAGVPETSDPALSSDGRYVAFDSGNASLVGGDTNGVGDIFVLDRDKDVDGTFDEAGETSLERVSVSSFGAQANANCFWPTISGDGRYVAFYTEASTLVPGDGNGALDVFVHDRAAGTTRRMSVSSFGNPGSEDSFEPRISAGERYVAYASDATNLVAGDTNGDVDIFVSNWQEDPIDITTPSWTGGSLTASEITADSLKLTWTDSATDNVAVTGYKIYRDGTPLDGAVVDINTRSANITGLSAGTQYTFKVEAGDAAGNWSTDGPSVIFTTAGGAGAVPEVLSKTPDGAMTYTVTIPVGAVNSTDGVPLAEEYIFTFTVQEPDEQ